MEKRKRKSIRDKMTVEIIEYRSPICHECKKHMRSVYCKEYQYPDKIPENISFKRGKCDKFESKNST